MQRVHKYRVSLDLNHVWFITGRGKRPHNLYNESLRRPRINGVNGWLPLIQDAQDRISF